MDFQGCNKGMRNNKFHAKSISDRLLTYFNKSNVSTATRPYTVSHAKKYRENRIRNSFSLVPQHFNQHLAKCNENGGQQISKEDYLKCVDALVVLVIMLAKENLPQELDDIMKDLIERLVDDNQKERVRGAWFAAELWCNNNIKVFNKFKTFYSASLLWPQVNQLAKDMIEVKQNINQQPYTQVASPRLESRPRSASLTSNILIYNNPNSPNQLGQSSSEENLYNKQDIINMFEQLQNETHWQIPPIDTILQQILSRSSSEENLYNKQDIINMFEQPQRHNTNQRNQSPNLSRSPSSSSKNSREHNIQDTEDINLELETSYEESNNARFRNNNQSSLSQPPSTSRTILFSYYHNSRKTGPQNYQNSERSRSRSRNEASSKQK